MNGRMLGADAPPRDRSVLGYGLVVSCSAVLGLAGIVPFVLLGYAVEQLLLAPLGLAPPATMIDIKNLATLAAVVNIASDVNAVTADPAVRKSAAQFVHDLRQVARSGADLANETTHAWGRVRANRTTPIGTGTPQPA